MKRLFSRSVLQLHHALTGRSILARLEELNASQWLSLDELNAIQQAKLLHLLRYANQYVPYYQRLFAQIGFQPEDALHDSNALWHLPLLTKDLIRANWNDLVTTHPDHRRGLRQLSTSGSTGQPLVFLQDASFRDAVTADIQRHMGWGGWQLGDAQAIVWGASLTASPSKRMRAQLIDWSWNRFKINAFLMTEARMAAFARRVRREKPRILFGYASSIHQLAQFVRQRGIDGIGFEAVFTSAERLLPVVRMEIESVFGCRVFNRYGTLDAGGIACECEAHSGLHVSMENVLVQIAQPDGCTPVPTDMLGDVVVTNLNNFGMPFIRYSIGDATSWHTGPVCSCGRALPMLHPVEGRVAELFRTRDGRRVRAAFSSGFGCLAQPSIQKFQAVQKSVDHVVMRLVPQGEIPQATLDEIARAMQVAFGENVTTSFELVDAIPAMPSGKHQYAICEVDKAVF